MVRTIGALCSSRSVQRVTEEVARDHRRLAGLDGGERRPPHQLTDERRADPVGPGDELVEGTVAELAGDALEVAVEEPVAGTRHRAA